jgi:hypothetical protein
VKKKKNWTEKIKAVGRIGRAIESPPCKLPCPDGLPTLAQQAGDI